MDDKLGELKGKAKEFLVKTALPNVKKAAGKVGRKLEELSGEDTLREVLKSKKEALMRTGLKEDEAKNTLKKLVSRILSE